MTFLNPLVLVGLAAAAIPLLLHLLNLRKLQTIDFSSLAFLKELQQSKIRRLKLRQLILLIIRTLLIIFIILAFARPAIRGTILGSIGSHANSTVVIILDDSFTMAASDEHGERLKQAKDAALRIIDLLKDGDDASLLRLSDVPKATIDPASHDFSLLRKSVNETHVSPIHRTFGDALRLSAKILDQSHNANKEIYLVTDMQATQFRSDVKADSVLRLFGERISVFLLQIGSKPVANSAIDSLAVTTSIFEVGKPITLYTSIRNFSDAPLNNSVISVYLDVAPSGSTSRPRRSAGSRRSTRSTSATPTARTPWASAPTRSARSWAATRSGTPSVRPPGRRPRRDDPDGQSPSNGSSATRRWQTTPPSSWPTGSSSTTRPPRPPSSWWTTCAPASRSHPPEAPNGRHLQGGHAACSPASRRPRRRRCGRGQAVLPRPTRGLIAPDQFIPLAESTGLIVPLGEWILGRACADAASWPAPVKIAVNISAVQFKKGNLFEVILCTLVESGLAPERLPPGTRRLEQSNRQQRQTQCPWCGVLHAVPSVAGSII